MILFSGSGNVRIGYRLNMSWKLVGLNERFERRKD